MTPPPSPAVEGGAAVPGHSGRARHVLLFPLPYQGHINPMLRLAGVLHARGFAVTVFHTHFNAPDAARHPEHRFVAVPDGMSGRPPPVSVDDVVKHIHALNGACEAAFRDRLAAVLAEYSRDAVTCFVADAHLLRMVEVARRLTVPTLVLRTGSAACFAGFLAYPLLCDKGYLPSSQLDMAVSELPPYRVRDLMHIGRDGHELMCELVARAVAAVKLSSGLILNTFDALEAPELAKLRRDLAVPVFDIGPLHKFSPAADGSLLHQDRSCLEWLDTQVPESVLYVSFGSLACMGARELVETAWGIAGSGVPFLWVVRPGLVGGRAPDEAAARLLPEGFEAATRRRGVVVAWAPQEEVLRHRAVGGFWTHNGWNSTTESLGEGVPMLCRPNFGDQMGNARYVEHVWKAGFEVAGGELERATVEAAIRRLMTESDGGEMRARARELKKAAAECTGKASSSEMAIVKMVTHMLSL
uniref:Uncharacterized protein n=1 Tax=Oryza punctata TaxID=4537 RepID=A0A0E0KKX2_ORYPU